MEIIKVLQGGVRLNRCLLDGEGCEFKSSCEINTKLSCLQRHIDDYLDGITLAEIVKENEKH